MKRILLFTIAAIALFSSCTKVIRETTTIEKIEELEPQVVLLNVPQDSWRYSYNDNNNYFFVVIELPEMTEAAFRGGMMKMYRTYDFDSKNATQIEMPYIRLNEFQYEDGTWGFYTETVDYEFKVGSVTIFYTASDFDYELNETFVPEAMSFRAVIYE